ncbi:hypothetical protein [Dyella sp.]|uniref:hypothetical protein n=1 Tax=Dyella sp. TaxID=1869338 RepID=UPI002D7846CC|nr:hypothetical protein [Dyella sp.]HET7332731.1 hypothetical protein [Dyella sp.]
MKPHAAAADGSAAPEAMFQGGERSEPLFPGTASAKECSAIRRENLVMEKPG